MPCDVVLYYPNIKIIKHKFKLKMKRKLFLKTLIMGFVMFFAADMKAQNDGFFTQQSGDNRTGNSYNIVAEGAGIEGFTNETPLSGGLFALTATGLVYLIGKRRKENE